MASLGRAGGLLRPQPPKGGSVKMVGTNLNDQPEPKTAKELAEQVLVWAKRHKLFSKVPIEEGVNDEEAFSLPSQQLFRAYAIEEILRKRLINLVGFNEQERKVVIFTSTKATQSERKILPFSSGGITIEYIQGGVAQVRGNPPQSQNPSPYYIHKNFYCCGSSVFTGNCIGAGTLGLLAKDSDGKLYGLSNNHVVGACNHAPPGLPIIAPGPLDITEDGINPFTVGRHWRLLPISEGIPENIDISNNWDAACFELADDAKLCSMQGNAYDTPPIVLPPEAGMRVEKVGRTTGHTTGCIIAQIATPLPVEYSVPEYGVRKTVFFEEAFVVMGDTGPFSRGGDSGSLVIGYDKLGNKVSVGLVFAGNEGKGLSFILPLHIILKKLRLEVVSDYNVR